MLSRYSIKDLELMSGIKAHTLRIWELRYKILKPERTGTNIRYYNNSDLRRIINISILNKNGHKISHIAGLNDQELIEQVERYLNDYLRESNKIESLYFALLDMDEDRFESILNNSILNLGFENTIERIVFPFLKHLGNMWQIGAISSAQEHYISNMVRQKLIAGIDKLVPETNPNRKTFLFFLPGSELHEMGLLYTFYLARRKGHKCVYLGQCVPVEDLIGTARSVQPDYLVGIFTSLVSPADLAGFLKGCEEGIPGPGFLISGRLLLDRDDRIQLPSERFCVFEDFQEFRKWI